MKLNTFFKLLTCFCAGLVLCGVGAGVTVMEITSLKVVEAGSENSTKEKIYELPDGKKLYIDGGDSVQTIKDESIPQGSVKLVAEYPKSCEITFNEIEDMYLCETKRSFRIDEDEEKFEDLDIEDLEDLDYYDRDDNEYYTDDIERRSVKGLFFPNYSSDSNEWREITQILEHLKDKEIYVPGNRSPKYSFYINPADSGKIVFLWTRTNSNAWLEESGFISDSDDAADTSAKTDVTETTTETVSAPETTTETVSAPETTTEATSSVPAQKK